MKTQSWFTFRVFGKACSRLLFVLAAICGVTGMRAASPSDGVPVPKPGAVTWRAIGPGQFGAMFGIGVSPHDSKVIVVGGDMGLAFMTRDGGQHWRMLGRSGGEPFANPGYRGVWAVYFDPAMTPQPKLASTRYCLANPGTEYLVYQSKDHEVFTLELGAGTYRYEWFNPARGETAESGQVQAADGKQEFNPPFPGDAVLYLHRTKE